MFVELRTYAFSTSTRSRTRDCDSSMDGAVWSMFFESLTLFTGFWASMLSSRFRFAESRMASVLGDKFSLSGCCCGGGLRTPLTEAMAGGLCYAGFSTQRNFSVGATRAISEGSRGNV